MTLHVVERQTGRAACHFGPIQTKKAVVGNDKNGGSGSVTKSDLNQVKAQSFRGHRKLGRLSLMAFNLMWRPTSASSASASMRIRPNASWPSESPRSTKWAASATRIPRIQRSRPMERLEWFCDVGCGKSNCRVRRTRQGIIVHVHHYPPACRSGIRSSIDCSATSRDVARSPAHRQTGRRRTDRRDNDYDRTSR